MRDLYDNGNLCISWKTYAYSKHKLFTYHKYQIYDQNGDIHFLFIGPLQFKWWKMKDYSRMINRSDYFRAMEIYDQITKNLKLEKPPDFRLFMPTLPNSDPQPIPFRHTMDSLLVELTQEGYRHYEMLSNKHAKTLLAVWVIQHAG